MLEKAAELAVDRPADVPESQLSTKQFVQNPEEGKCALKSPTQTMFDEVSNATTSSEKHVIAHWELQANCSSSNTNNGDWYNWASANRRPRGACSLNKGRWPGLHDVLSSSRMGVSALSR